MIFDKNHELIGWFDQETQAETNGVPEGPLNEFMLKVEGPFVITERIYTLSGGVKAVIIKNFGAPGVNYSPGCPWSIFAV